MNTLVLLARDGNVEDAHLAKALALAATAATLPLQVAIVSIPQAGLATRALARLTGREAPILPEDAAALVALFPIDRTSRELARRAGVPLVALVSDMADSEPPTWLRERPDVAVVCSERAERQCEQAGIRAARIAARPLSIASTAAATPDQRAALRARHGLRHGERAVLVRGAGTGEALRALTRALEIAPGARLYVDCTEDGPSPDLRALQIEHLGRVVAVTSPAMLPEVARLCDVTVSPAASRLVAEAIHLRLPLLAVESRGLPRENARFVEDERLGVRVERWADVPAALGTLLADTLRLADLRARLAVRPPADGAEEALRALARVAWAALAA